MRSGAPGGDAVGDRFFWELLGVSPGSDPPAIKRAYHKKARENHPDFFPAADKALQEIKMIALNEAYAYVMSLPEAGIHADVHAAAGSGVRRAASPGDTTALGAHKEPGYAYYKQGFVHFSRAIHGIEALYQSISRYHRIHFRPRDDAFERFAGSLVELRRAHEYFTRVVKDHGGSIWCRDAELKLSRIERFSVLYRRIIGNLSRGG